MEIDINGEKYIRRELPLTPKKSSMLSSVIAMATMFGATTNTKNRPTVNLIEEFKLIQLKQSKLSRNDREWVEIKFHQLYKKVTIK